MKPGPATGAGQRSISVSEMVVASPQQIFELLATPARHTELDGSGMLKGRPQGPEVLGPGDRFTMGMSQGGIPYRSVNVVVEYEKDRLIAWETWGELGGRRLVGGQRWRYELEPDGTATRVTHTYDWSRARFPRLIVELPGYPKKMRTAMAATLSQLGAVTGRL
ncbi:SRPBCC family protein [Streptomyces spiramyceticus]|uniref:SRPBCC family protein n=1 Tax=Streptomyces spiramyceticus TaxID=299717 RepID=UPI00237BB894|nr:SRPBCC family protein [Streptomyces spiramyceticus]